MQETGFTAKKKVILNSSYIMNKKLQRIVKSRKKEFWEIEVLITQVMYTLVLIVWTYYQDKGRSSHNDGVRILRISSVSSETKHRNESWGYI